MEAHTQTSNNTIKSGGHNSSSNISNETTQNQQPNVRHIPIFVEGRDQPIVNRHIIPDESHGQSINNDHHHHSSFGMGGPSLVDRVKHIPVRTFQQNDDFRRTRGPSPTQRQVPVHQNTFPGFRANNEPTFIATETARPTSNQNVNPHAENYENVAATQNSSSSSSVNNDPISKIQNIQREVLSLMDKVEHFKGNSKKDREYVYLDEMLTQNLLKLDNIDSEGSENIKHARREAIKCINKCIEVLEAKVDSNGPQNREKNELNSVTATAV